MKQSLKTGVCFGLTSGIITTLGLMVGLHSGTHSTLAVIGGVLTIAVADAFSDALGIHMSEESENKHTKEVWESTLSTFLAKFVFAMAFIIPVLLFYESLTTAIIVSTVWGLLLIGALSFIIARERKVSPWKVITEHVGIALIVVIIAHYVGDLIAIIFG